MSTLSHIIDSDRCRHWGGNQQIYIYAFISSIIDADKTILYLFSFFFFIFESDYYACTEQYTSSQCMEQNMDSLRFYYRSQCFHKKITINQPMFVNIPVGKLIFI